MEPFHMNMQPYPHQNGQMHYRPPCYRGMEARPPMSHECWPWGGNYGYPPAGAYHGCCNHAYMPPHCAWGSPYSHVPPHPGSYPYFPVQYMPPPPYNVMEHPRYEYEKNMPMEHHCCGCRDHPLHQKEQRNVRIEEEEPDGGRGNDSLVPSQFKNSPYPIVWLPPDHKEHGKVKNVEGGIEASRDVKEHENGKTIQQKPAFWNGWLPLDLNNVGKDNSHQDDGKGNFQFLLFWMPYKPDDMGRENQKKVEDVNARPSSKSEEGSDGGEGGQEFNVNKGNIGDRSASRVRDIPVREVEDHIGKESSVNKASERDTSAKDGTNNSEKKIDNVEGPKRKPPSPPKSSKLPPVCLRVDPLPRRKSANAKSRSPSPPCDKQVKSNEDRSSGNEEQVKDGMKKKTIAVVDGNTSLEKSTNVVNAESPGKLQTEHHADVAKQQAEENPVEQVAQKGGETDAVTNGQSEDTVSAGGEKEALLTAEDTKIDAVGTHSKRALSEVEAAVVIQSAYRGFDVRRWEPLKKLKEIARVRERRADVKRLIQEMELSSDSQGREKQKNIIAETIMYLLLRLDTIQGLHPSIREVRKSEVRELVNLQEKLDTIMNEKSEDSPGQEFVQTSHDQENVSSKSEDALLSEKIGEIYSMDLQSKIVGESNPERAEFPEANPIDKAASVQIVTKAAESSMDEGVKSPQGPSVKDEDVKSSKLLEYDESHIPNGDCECSSLPDYSSTSATDLAPTNDLDVLETKLAELPQGVLDDLSIAEGMNYSAVEADSSDQSKQIDEALIGTPIDQEAEHEVANKEISDLPLDGVELETEEAGEGGYSNNCNVDFKSGTDEEVNSNTEDATSVPNECRLQHREGLIAGDNVASEASEEVDFTRNISTINELHENSGITDSTENETSCDAADDMVGLESTAAAESTGDVCIVEQSEGVSEMGMLSKQVRELNIENPPPNEAIENHAQEDQAEHEEDKAVELLPGGDDMRESNRKLMEENERLRDMMEKLIKSGHEQLTAISSLSGRVKDLEKRLRKKKLKVKQQLRAKKSSCEAM